MNPGTRPVQLLKTLHRSPLSALPLLAYMIMIFYASGKPVPAATRGFPDWLLHGIGYFVFYILAYMAVHGIFPDASLRNLLFSALMLSIIYGISDEIHQSFVPFRDASVKDVLADVIGAGLGGVVLYNLQRSPFLKLDENRLRIPSEKSH